MPLKFAHLDFELIVFLERNGHVNSQGLKENYKSKDFNCNCKSGITLNMSPTSLFCPQQV